MDKEEFHWVFGVMQGWFSAKLGSKISDESQLCQHNFGSHQQPQGHNKQKSTTFILPYGSNKQQCNCMDKEEFHWVFGFLQGWFSAKLGSKISDESQLCQHNFGSHQQPQGHRRHHMGLTNSNLIVWTRKSYVGSLVSCGVGFQQNLGQKSVMDPSYVRTILWPPTATGI
jgi:hypothetical protein